MQSFYKELLHIKTAGVNVIQISTNQKLQRAVQRAGMDATQLIEFETLLAILSKAPSTSSPNSTIYRQRKATQ